MDYRAEIDGLRAIAVVSVILFHMGFNSLSGGYVGVDVFFGISGYLIGYLVISKLKAGNFKFSEFFSRRIRRLFPAAFVVYIVTVIVFFFVFPQSLYKATIEGVASSLTFTSNLYYWQLGGYFGPTVETNPMLHTWSLSVEEQFYLFFPVLLYFLSKCFNKDIVVFSILLIAVLVSLFLAVAYTPSAISFAGFYLLPVRVYELGLGVLCAFIHFKGWFRTGLNKGYIKDLGLLMIVVSLFLFNKATPFPSYNALLPVVGCCLFLLSTSTDCLSYKVTTNRVFIYLGLVSYSLYLWHWPVIVLADWMAPYDKNVFDYLAMVVTMLAIAHVSWKCIEKPFRSYKADTSTVLRRYLVINFGFLSVLFLLWIGGNGFYSDPDGKIGTVYQQAIEPEPGRAQCTDKIKNEGVFFACHMLSNKPHAKKIFVWGDSHGSALMPAFEKTASEIDVFYANNTGCLPLLDVTSVSSIYGDCELVNRLVWEHLSKVKYDLVVLIGAFDNYMKYGFVTDVASRSMDSVTAIRQGVHNQAALFDSKQMNYLIFEQAIEFRFSVPDYYLNEAMTGVSHGQNKMQVSSYLEQGTIFRQITEGIAKENVVNIFLEDCKDSFCPSALDGSLLYKDNHHISNTYAKSLNSRVYAAVVSRLKDD